MVRVTARAGVYESKGEGKGKGLTVNLPLGKRMTGAFMEQLYESVVLPKLREFRPEMIFVSAGFDGHELDPMEGLDISTSSYLSLNQKLLTVAEELGGKLLYCLEGGYNPIVLGDCVTQTCLQLSNQPIGLAAPVNPSTSSPELIDQFIAYHRVP